MNDLVYTVYTEGDRYNSRAYDLCHRAWKNWCNQNNKHFFAYKIQNSNIIEPHWWKYKIFDILKSRGLEYDRICFVDSDTLPHNKCPDFFEFITDSRIYIVPNFGSLDWVIRGIENYSTINYYFGYEPSIESYFNTGFMLFNNRVKTLFDGFTKFVDENSIGIQHVIDKYKGGRDQTLFNLYSSIWPKEYLSYMFNMQDLPRREVFRTDGIGEELFWTDYGYIFHFNCIDNIRPLIEKVYNKLWT